MNGCGTADNPVSVETYVYDGKPEQIVGMVLTGSPRERGKTYGWWLRALIRANVQWHKDHPHLPLWDLCVKMAETYYLPGLQNYWPDGLEELKGMSQTSGVPIEHLVVLNARDDLASLIPDEVRANESTSAFFSSRATASNTPMLAHSWTSAGSPRDTELLVCIKIQYPINENKPDIIMVTEAGRISGCGMNARGMAATGNRLFSTDDGRGDRARGFFPMTCFERFILEYDGVAVLPHVPDDTTRNASRHILAADRTGRSASLELGVEHSFSHGGEFGSWVIVHGNHFQSFDAFCCRHELRDQYIGDYSQARLSRFKELIKGNETGVSRQQIVDMFSDHKGSPKSICQHRDDSVDGETMVFVMFDIKRRVISVCKGPPCRGVMSHFTLDRRMADAAKN